MDLMGKRWGRTAGLVFLLAVEAWSQGQKPAATTPAPPAPAATVPASPAPGQTRPAAPAQAPAPQSPTGQAAPPAAVKTPAAELVWSVNLEKGAPEVPGMDVPRNAQRSAVIAGDRVVAVYSIGAEVSRGGRPVDTYRMVSLDLGTGAVKGEKKLELHSFPYLFATGDDHVLLGRSSLTRYNPDLTESGERFVEPGQGWISCISPDGNTLARWTVGGRGTGDGGTSDRGTELISATTLTWTSGLIRGAEPSSVSGAVLLTDDPFWARQFPGDASFVTLVDRGRPRLLYRGNCGGRPEFLSGEKILSIACGKAKVMDTAGRALKEITLDAPHGRFGGVSRDGSRFAIETSGYPPNDPAYGATEMITVYDGTSFEAVTTVQLDRDSDTRPWTAFASDGHLFLSGSANRLSLYRIPF